jgi:hypothetical protein
VSERYEDFLGELPKFPPDPRQSEFIEAAQGGSGYQRIHLDQHLGKVEIANIGRGWRASAPDLGFLQLAVQTLIKRGKLDLFDKKGTTTLVKWAIQRVVRVTLSKESETRVTIRFMTRDDKGIYEYGFPVEIA